MAVYCPACHTANREGSSFCNHCGEKLAQVSAPEIPVVTAPDPITEDDGGDAEQSQGESDVISLDQVPAAPPVLRPLALSAAELTESPQHAPAAPNATDSPAVVAPATPVDGLAMAATAPADQPAQANEEAPVAVPPAPPVSPVRGQAVRSPQPLLRRVRPSATARAAEPVQPAAAPARAIPWRQLAYLALAAAIIIGLLLPTGTLGSSVTPSAEVADLYKLIESLPLRSTALVSFDYEPALADEMNPLASAVVTHLMRRQARILTMSLLPQGPAMADAVMGSVAATRIYAYGVDYVNLGYFAGDEAALASLGTNFKRVLGGDDAHGQAMAGMAVVRSVDSLSAVKLMIELSGDENGVPRWVEQVHSRTGIHLAAATSAVALPMAFPYLQSGQVSGLASGLPAAAQYEHLLGYSGPATRGMDAQTLGHIVVLLFIVAGNVALFWTQRKPQQA